MDAKKLTKMENGENKNLQGRREFFKEAAKKALPILGAVALMSNPVIANALEHKVTGCESNCSISCKGTCAGKCEGCCAENGCKGTCSGTCNKTCSNSTK